MVIAPFSREGVGKREFPVAEIPKPRGVGAQSRKAGRAMRMERVVRELMAEPLKAEELLVRQGKEWQI
jgi:hypothetical protein